MKLRECVRCKRSTLRCSWFIPYLHRAGAGCTVCRTRVSGNTKREAESKWNKLNAPTRRRKAKR